MAPMSPESRLDKSKLSISQINDSAEIFIKKYGNDAPQQAKQRADELMAIGNRQGGNLWLRICRQIEKTLKDQ